jgi:PPK2 family polyphosphate:nucleotide phosphotransferase
MEIKTGRFLVHPGKAIDLDDWPTLVKPLYESETDYKGLLGKRLKAMIALQRLMYASDRYSLLLIFQGMDSAGKDGVIRHVMSGVNPQGCQVFSFSHPSASEVDHDFLWRTARCLPERGRIGIFNRSYYEEVLIVRVHPEILRSQRIPNDLIKEDSVWEGRYRSIIDHERHLFRNGTRILKFFLHLSKGEQKKRFLQRIDDPEKNWKFSLADIKERGYWNQYMKAYEACLAATSTKEAPWYIVPADDKSNARLIVAEVIVDAMERLGMRFPKSGKARRSELKTLRQRLR